MTQKLLNDIKEAANILKDMKESQINILTHYDADGLSAAGSLVSWFRNQNTKFLCISVFFSQKTSETLKNPKALHLQKFPLLFISDKPRTKKFLGAITNFTI